MYDLTTQAPEPLLKRHPVFATADAEQFRAVAMQSYGAARVELAKFDATPSCGNVAVLTDLSIGYSRCGEAQIAFPEAEFARIQFAVQGQGRLVCGRQETAIAAGMAAVTSPGQASTITYGRDFAQLYLRIGQAALERKLAALLGATTRGRIELSGAATMSDGAMLGLWQLTRFVADQLDVAPARLPSAVLAELENAVIVAFLCATRHNFSRLVTRDTDDTTPAGIRLVEDFIHAHCGEAITVEQLAAVGGVSVRTLHYGFLRHRGYSPYQFVKRVRLERARELLKHPGARTSVSAVALSCGFMNLGHFARDYRLAFGALPSAELARAMVEHGG